MCQYGQRWSMTWMKNEKSQVLKFKDKIKRFTKDTCNSWTKSRLTEPRCVGCVAMVPCRRARKAKRHFARCTPANYAGPCANC